MFKAIKEFFFGKPVAAPKVEDCPVMGAPVAKPVEDLADIAIAQRPVATKPAQKPAAKAPAKAPAKKQGGQKPAQKTGGAKPAQKTGGQKPKGGRKPKAAKPAAK